MLFLFLLITQSLHPLVAQSAPRKVAFVVGVSEYQKTGLANLKFAHKDANDLAVELKRQGFEVTKLIGSQAQHEKVRSALDKFIGTTSDLGKNDIVLISFSGHGVQKTVSKSKRLVETPFFCVYDTLVTKPETMISLNRVLEQLKEDSACNSNLLLVDACRNNPDKGARTLDGSTVRELPTKISMLFSSSAGQKSFESEKAKQGIFTHVLLKGLRGEAANSRGQVKWLSLASYVVEEVPLHVSDLLENSDAVQRPNLVGNIITSPTLSDKVKVSPLVAPFGKDKGDSSIKNPKIADQKTEPQGKVYSDAELREEAKRRIGNFEHKVANMAKTYSLEAARKWEETVISQEIAKIRLERQRAANNRDQR
jgi:hypothetical protein